MNWEALGAVAELIGAGAVVFSLLYFAVQVRASLRQARFDANREVAGRIAEASLAVAANRDLAEVFLRGASDFEGLDEVDQVRFRGLMNALFRGFEQQLLLWKAQVIDDESWSTVSGVVKDFAGLPGVRHYLVERSTWYSPSFRSYLRETAGLQYPQTRLGMVDQYLTPETDPPN